MNKVIMMGRIVNDLELKTTPSGVSVCKFRIAVDRNYQKQGEEKVSDFFNITVWRSTAEFVCRYFAKGRMILVEGELQTSPYTDKNGNKSTWYEIMAEKAFFTGEKSNSNPAQVTLEKPVTAQNKGNSGQNQKVIAQAGDNEDYPF